MSIMLSVDESMCSYFGREKEGGVIELGTVKPSLIDVIAPELF